MLNYFPVSQRKNPCFDIHVLSFKFQNQEIYTNQSKFRSVILKKIVTINIKVRSDYTLIQGCDFVFTPE